MEEKKKFTPPPLPLGKSRPMAPPVRTQVAQGTPGKPQEQASMPGSAPSHDKIPLERQVEELQKQLLEEREKHLIQTIRTKEEEVTATRVEESIRSIQDKLRREKREQELQESLAKAETHTKDLERRIIEERETWMQTMRAQVSQRDVQDKELEQGFQLRIKDLERKWQEEKNSWIQDLRYNEDELKKLKDDYALKESEINRNWEKKIRGTESENTRLTDEIRALKADMQAKEKDLMSFKAQLTLYSSQIRQEKEREEKYHQLINRLKGENEALIQKLNTQEKEYFVLKTQSGVMSARTKAEQERLMKELGELKERSGEMKHQHELSAKSKDDEIYMMRERSSAKETELRHSFEKKEEELKGIKAEYDEKLRNRDTAIQSLNNREKELLAKKAEYEMQLSEKNGIIETAHAQIQEIESQLEDISEERQSERARYSADTDKLQRQQEEDRAQVHNLTGKVNESEKLIQELRMRLSESNLQVQSVDKDRNELKAEIGSLKNEMHLKEQKMEELKSDNHALSAKMAEVQTTMKFLQEKNEELKGKVAADQVLLDNQRRALEEKQNEIARAKDVLDKKDEEIGGLEKQLEIVKREIDERVAKEVGDFRKRTNHLEQLNSELQNQVISRDRSITEILSHEEQIKRKYAEQLREVEEQFNQQKAKIGLRLTDKENEVGELLTRIDKLSRAREHFEQIAKEAEEGTDGFQKKIAELTSAKIILERQLKRDSDKKDETIVELRNSIKSLEEQAAAGRNSIIAERDKLNRYWEEKMKGANAALNEYKEKFTGEEGVISQKIREVNKEWEARLAAKEKDKEGEIEAAMEKVEAKWKDFHSKFVEEHEVLQGKLQQREQELAGLREKYGEPGSDIAKNIVGALEASSETVKEKKGFKLFKNFWHWLNKPVMHL